MKAAYASYLNKRTSELRRSTHNKIKAVATAWCLSFQCNQWKEEERKTQDSPLVAVNV